jgi:hypothetical protein
VPEATGALQRLGLTVVDGWHVVAALLVLRTATVARSDPP